MIIVETSTYLRHKKKILSKKVLTQEQIDEAIELLKQDKNNPKLQYKKIVCKKDKRRHSFRVPNTQYRFLVSDYLKEQNTIYLLMILEHKKYDRANKDC